MVIYNGIVFSFCFMLSIKMIFLICFYFMFSIRFLKMSGKQPSFSTKITNR